jgi:hypothetical protein
MDHEEAAWPWGLLIVFATMIGAIALGYWPDN